MTNTIIRAQRRHRFVIVDQRAIEDGRLSWAARGLLAYLLSRPDDWKVLVNDLQRRGDLKRDGIHKLLRELRNVGYVHYQRRRDPDGRIRGGTYFVQEVPASPHPGSPDTAQPDSAPPDPAKPDASPNTDQNSRRTTTTTPTTTKSGCSRDGEQTDVEFVHWVPDELRESARAMVANLPPALAQMVIDEWAGALDAGSIRRSRLGYLRALVERMAAGQLIPKFADEVAQARRQSSITA